MLEEINTDEPFIDPMSPICQTRYDNLLYHLCRYNLASKISEIDDIVIDFGCGSGYGTRFLSNKVKTVYGFDVNEDVLKIARQQYQAKNVVFTSDISKLSGFESNLIVFNEVIEHMPQTQAEETLSFLKERLVHGGRIIVSTPRYLPSEERSANRNKYHINEFTFESFKSTIRSVFSSSLFLTQTDEIITFGNPKVCWSFIAIGTKI